MLKISLYILVFISSVFTFSVEADGSIVDPAMNSRLLHIEHVWAEINFRTKENDQESAYEILTKDIDALANDFPESAEPKVWQGIIRSSYAGAAGGLTALSYVKEARDYLRAAKAINDLALQGSIYMSLGTLYGKVPGWPLSFGDNHKARKYFMKALKINPHGLEPNYLYAEYLYDNDEYADARKYLNIALAAPALPGRQITDIERRRSIERLLEKLDKQSY